MSSHPMLSNAMHARMQRKRLEQRAEMAICTKAAEPIITPVFTQQTIAAVAAAQSHTALPTTIRKPHHNHHNGHHHVHHGNTLMIGGLDTKMLESVQKLFARRILH